MSVDKTAAADGCRKDVEFLDAGKKPYRKPKLVEYGSVVALTGSFAGPNTGDKSAKMTTPSTLAVKENIVRIGEHPQGFGLYLFDYKAAYRGRFGEGRQFGVIAEEVERIVPDAVSINTEGIKVVNYGLLNVRRTLQ